MKKESSIKINILQKEKNAMELLPEALAVFAAAITSSSVASRRPYRIFSITLPVNR